MINISPVPPKAEEDMLHLGWYFFPIKIVYNPGEKIQKIPLVKWKAGSSNSAEQLAWWRKKYEHMFAADTNTYFAFGIDCEKSHLFVLDDDRGKTPAAAKSLLALEFENGPIPRTFKAQTISLGYHSYLHADGKSTAGKLGPGLDTRGQSGYVVSPFSAGYSITDYCPVADAPSWLLDLAGRTTERTSEAPAVVEGLIVDSPQAIALATQYLGSADFATEGDNGDSHTYNVACRVMDYGVSPETALDLMLSNWNDYCSPAWEPDNLWTKIQNAARYRNQPVGVSNPQAAFPDLTEEQLSALGAYGSYREKGKSRYKLLRSSDVDKFPPLEWRVKGVLPSRGLSQMYGPSRSGKSFLIFDMLAAIAEGREWFGHRTKACPVIYVCLEGEYGMQQRKQAWEKENGRRLPDNFYMIAQSWGITINQDVKDLVAVSPRGCVIAIDTQNRAAPGANENASEDMGRILNGAKSLESQVCGMIVLLTHTGKDLSKGVRGHSSQVAAMDAGIEVRRDGDLRWWRSDKVKDGKDGEIGKFMLKIVHLRDDEDGDPVTSCVIDRDISSLLAETDGFDLSPIGADAWVVAKTLASESITGEFTRASWTKNLKEQWPKKADGTKRNQSSEAIREIITAGLVKKVKGVYVIGVLTEVESDD